LIDFFGYSTSNCQKVAIALEELGLPYAAHWVNLKAGVHREPSFRAMHPYARIPVIVDHDAPGGELAVAESLAILVYLTEKAGALMPRDPAGRSRALQWLSSIAANINPIFRALDVFSNMLPVKLEPAIDHYIAEGERALAILDRHLADRRFMIEDAYSIVDISAYTVAATSASRLPRGIAECPNLLRWSSEIGQRPAVIRGMRLFT
jgi:glutathione S-transferase